MYICNCNGITDREIRGAVSLGCTSLKDLTRELGVGTRCGKCVPDAARVLRDCESNCCLSPAVAAGD